MGVRGRRSGGRGAGRRKLRFANEDREEFSSFAPLNTPRVAKGSPWSDSIVRALGAASFCNPPFTEIVATQ
jgi:hypothetical protein